MKDVIIQILRDYALNTVFPRVYSKYAKQAINPNKVLFVEIKKSSMPDAFFRIWDYLKDRGYELEFYSLEQHNHSYLSYYKRSKELMKKMATARCVFLADSSDIVSCPAMRSETFVCQLWHACGAFKKWGLSTTGQLFGSTSERHEKHPYYKNLNLVTVSAPEVEWAYREAMGLENTPEVIQATGVSRTDVFFDSTFIRDAYSWLYEAVPTAANKKVIFYAPTFRGAPKKAIAPQRLAAEQMAATLGEDYILLIKHHPFIKNPPPIPVGCEQFAYLMQNAPIDKLLAVSDICITDYSSIIFEYSLFERPMLFFAYDKDEYTDWRGFYYDYESFVPGPIVKSTREIVDFILNIDECFNRQQVVNFKKKFMSACDGRATERIANIALSHYENI